MQKDKPQAIFVIGGPGCGKGTQCTLMKERFRFIHLSTGSLLRQYCENQSEDAQKINQMMKKGILVPSSTIVQVLLNKVESFFPNHSQFIMDGFPRNHQNHEQWGKTASQKVNVAMVLYIQCEIEVLRERLLKRAKTSTRIDDNPKTIEERFVTFKESTVPIIEKYRQQHPKFISVNGMGTEIQVTHKIELALRDFGLIGFGSI